MAQQRQDLEAEAKDAAVGYLAQHGIEQKLSECLKTLRPAEQGGGWGDIIREMKVDAIEKVETSMKSWRKPGENIFFSAFSNFYASF